MKAVRGTVAIKGIFDRSRYGAIGSPSAVRGSVPLTGLSELLIVGLGPGHLSLPGFRDVSTQQCAC